MTITVIYGPPGSGKTTNRDYLKGKYNAERVLDDWPHMEKEAKDGDLLLTTNPATAPVGSIVIHIAEALR